MLTLQEINDATADLFNVTTDEFYSQRRLRTIVMARQVAMYLTRTLTAMSFNQIADAFGKDHTTIMHAVRKIPAAMKTNTDLAAQVNYLELALRRADAARLVA